MNPAHASKSTSGPQQSWSTPRGHRRPHGPTAVHTASQRTVCKNLYSQTNVTIGTIFTESFTAAEPSALHGTHATVRVDTAASGGPAADGSVYLLCHFFYESTVIVLCMVSMMDAAPEGGRSEREGLRALHRTPRSRRKISAARRRIQGQTGNGRDEAMISISGFSTERTENRFYFCSRRKSPPTAS